MEVGINQISQGGFVTSHASRQNPSGKTGMPRQKSGEEDLSLWKTSIIPLIFQIFLM